MQAVMKRSGAGAFILGVAALCIPVADAAQVSVSNAAGAPGGTVTVWVEIDAVPLDDSGLFTLDLDLEFDPVLVIISDVRAGSLAAPADFLLPPPFDVPPAFPLASSPFTLGIIGSFTDPGANPAPPGGGSLLEIDLQISPAAGLGQVAALDLVFIDNNTGQISASSLQGGSITVVPLPAAVWLMPAALGLLAGLGRRRRAS